MQSLRGILNPLLDRQMAGNEKFAAIVREGDAEAAASRPAEAAPVGDVAGA